MGTLSATQFFSEAFTWFANLSSKLPKIDFKTFFIVVVALLIGVGIVVGLTYFGSYRFKLLAACKRIIKYLEGVDSIDDDNVKDFTDQCFSVKAPTVLCDNWKLYLGVRFGYPSDIVSERTVYDDVVKRIREVRASVYIGIALVLIAIFSFWGYGTLDGNDMGVIFCTGLLLSGAMYLVLIILNRMLSKRCLDVFDNMQLELDAKVDLQVDKSYATDSSPLSELAAIVDEIIARNTAKNVGFDVGTYEETPIEKLIANAQNAQQNSEDINPADFGDFYDVESFDKDFDDEGSTDEGKADSKDAGANSEDKSDGESKDEATDDNKESGDSAPDDGVKVDSEKSGDTAEDSKEEREAGSDDADTSATKVEVGEEKTSAAEEEAKDDASGSEEKGSALSSATDEDIDDGEDLDDEKSIRLADILKFYSDDNEDEEDGFDDDEESEDELDDDDESDEESDGGESDGDESEEDELDEEDEADGAEKEITFKNILKPQSDDEASENGNGDDDLDEESDDEEFDEDEYDEESDDELDGEDEYDDEDEDDELGENEEDNVVGEHLLDDGNIDDIDSDDCEADDDLDDDDEEEYDDDEYDDEDEIEEDSDNIGEDVSEEEITFESVLKPQVDEVDEASEGGDEEDADENEQTEDDEPNIKYVIEGPTEDEEVVKPAKLVKLPNLVDYVIANNPSPNMLINVSRLMLIARGKYEHSTEDRRIVDNCIGKLIVALHSAYMSTKI